jgi:hypothetical protein
MHAALTVFTNCRFWRSRDLGLMSPMGLMGQRSPRGQMGLMSPMGLMGQTHGLRNDMRKVEKVACHAA